MPDGSIVSSRPSIRVAGQPNTALSDAALEVVVRAPENGMASAEIRAVNWSSESGGEPDFSFTAIALGTKLDIAFGLDTERVLFSGEITGIEERYGDGAPQIALLAEDGLRKLARRRRSRALEQSADDIVKSLAADAGLRASVKLSATKATYHQLNESDLSLLRRLAAMFGGRIRLDGTTVVARVPEPASAQPVELSTRDQIRRLRLSADLARIPAKVRVGGWDLSNGSAVSGSSDSLRVPPSGTAAKSILAGTGWSEDATFADPAPLAQAGADERAAAAYDEQARRFVSGDLICTGNSRVVPGGSVRLSGVSPRLLGDYDVVAAMHSFDAAHGYETYARIERGWWR